MRNVFWCGLLCAVLLPVLGCTSTDVVTSTAPIMYTHSESAKFVILGEVRYETSDSIDNIGYSYNDMLRAARRLYPDCDYVIDIMVDKKAVVTTKKTTLFFWSMQSVDAIATYTMRGTAIKYVK